MLLPYRLGLGGPISGGAQWMSWIHRDDLVGMIQWLLERDQAGGAQEQRGERQQEAFSRLK